MARRGRPRFQWTDEIESEILQRISMGESVVEMLGPERGDFLPSETSFYERLMSDAEFAERYARAREVQAHREVEEIISIADLATNDGVAVAKLRIDARKWRASKLAPKSYGDKQRLEHVGDAAAPLVHEVRRTIVRPDNTDS